MTVEVSCCNNCPFLHYTYSSIQKDCIMLCTKLLREIPDATITAMATDKDCPLLKKDVIVTHKEKQNVR